MTTQQTGPNYPALISKMALELDVDSEALAQVLRHQVLKGASPTDVAAFLIVATQYGLNPITKEIYAFPAKGGGITPIVGVDGWIKLANKQPTFDGLDFADTLDANGALVSVTCRVHRKDRAHPTVVTEYLAECRKGTEPWKQWPSRMLRHKAMVQAFRIAFGFSGIFDPDEAERIDSARTIDAPTSKRSLAQVLAETPAQVVEGSRDFDTGAREPGSDDEAPPLATGAPEVDEEEKAIMRGER